MPSVIGHTTRLGNARPSVISRVIRTISEPQLCEIMQAYALLLITDWGVRCVGLAPVWQCISSLCRSKHRPAHVSAEIARLLRPVRVAAAHHLYPMKCLPQSLALACLLAVRGIPTELRLGVARNRIGIEAHAWLELDGFAINDSSERTQRFVAL